MERRRWCRVLVRTGQDTLIGAVDLLGPVEPDLAAVDVLARLALAAGRARLRIEIVQADARIVELVNLTGIPEAGPPRAEQP